MAGSMLLFSILALNFFCDTAFAFDSRPLQDFCVADLTTPSRMNGLPCMDPAKVKEDDFFFSGLHVPGNTSNPRGSSITAVAVKQIPGLNTLGLAMARLDIKENGFFPPHVHARAAKIFTVLEGSMEVGFVTSDPSHRHYSKVLEKGDVFVVPIGLVHYLRSVGAVNTVSITVLNSQDPGTTSFPDAVFGANPNIDAGYLGKAFALDRKFVEDMQGKF